MKQESNLSSGQQNTSIGWKPTTALNELFITNVKDMGTHTFYAVWKGVISYQTQSYIKTLEEHYGSSSKMPEDVKYTYENLKAIQQKGIPNELLIKGAEILVDTLEKNVKIFLDNFRNDKPLCNQAFDATYELVQIFACHAVMAYASSTKNTAEEKTEFMCFALKNLDTESYELTDDLCGDLTLQDINKIDNNLYDDCDRARKHLQEPLNNLKKEIKFLELLKLLHTTEQNYTEEKTNGEKSRPLSRFQYSGPKPGGNEIGILAQKKLRGKDDPKHQKYGYTWLIKHQHDMDTIADFIGSGIYRFFLGDMAPKNRLVSNDKQVLLASRFIDDFQTSEQIFSKKCKSSIASIIDKTMQIPGIFEVIAASLLAGNYDLHPGNIGATGNKAAIVDLARSLNFRAGYNAFTTGGSNEFLLKGANDLNKGQPYRPEDMIRSLHYGFYKIDSAYFLNVKFAEALENVAEKMEKEGKELKSIIKNSAKEVTHAYKHLNTKYIEKELEKIGAGTTLKNLGNTIFEGLKERAPMLKEFALNIRIQLAMQEGNIKTLETLLNGHPEVFDKKIKWLTYNNEERILTPRDVCSFAKYHCNEEVQKCVNTIKQKQYEEKNKPKNLRISPESHWIQKTGKSPTNSPIQHRDNAQSPSTMLEKVKIRKQDNNIINYIN